MKLIYLTTAFILLFINIGCENSIEGPGDEINSGGSTGVLATFSSIQVKVFSKTCAVSGCHNGTQNPNLTSGQAYNNLVNKPSIENPGLLRVKPGESQNSYLIKKLTADGTNVMPPTARLAQSVIDSIKIWIDNGAFNN